MSATQSRPARQVASTAIAVCVALVLAMPASFYGFILGGHFGVVAASLLGIPNENIAFVVGSVALGGCGILLACYVGLWVRKGAEYILQRT